MKNYEGVPSFDELIEPCFEALEKLGGSGTVNEIYEQVIKDLKLDDKVLSIMQIENGGQTKVAYNLAWARTYLKKFGAVNNPTHKVWEITTAFKGKTVNRKEVIAYKSIWGVSQKINNLQQPEKEIEIDDIPEENKPWNEDLLKSLLSMNPYSFERLAQLVLRNMGLDDVKVTKKSNDGGIDGYGIFKLNGVISFRLAFQCKRYKGSVSSREIRDFRGSCSSDIEKYLFITTGTFTQDAKTEASMPGKPKIDLIDGDDLIAKLIEYKIGVKETTTYIVDKGFFANF